MATVGDILVVKGRSVVSMVPTASVLDAARVMNERGIGGVLVRDGKGLVGVFTERDVLRRVVAEQRNPATTRLRDVMTAPVITCGPETTVEACMALMTEKRVRRMPIADEDGLCGIITIGDLLAHQVGVKQDEIQHLHKYMFDLRP